MVPRPQIYFVRGYLKNVAAPVSILNITARGSARDLPQAYFLYWNKYDHGIMTIVIAEAADEEDGSRFL
jgi:hypothetical protein